MAKGDGWLKFFGQDFFSSERVIALSPAGECAFLRMLWIQHLDGSCPDDPELVALKTCTRLKRLKAGWNEARALFDQDENGRLVNRQAAEKQGIAYRGAPRKDSESEDDAERRRKEREKKARQRQAQKEREEAELARDNSRGQEGT
jgi:hypothetical protein